MTIKIDQDVGKNEILINLNDESWLLPEEDAKKVLDYFLSLNKKDLRNKDGD